MHLLRSFVPFSSDGNAFSMRNREPRSGCVSDKSRRNEIRNLRIAYQNSMYTRACFSFFFSGKSAPSRAHFSGARGFLKQKTKKKKEDEIPQGFLISIARRYVRTTKAGWNLVIVKINNRNENHTIHGSLNALVTIDESVSDLETSGKFPGTLEIGVV